MRDLYYFILSFFIYGFLGWCTEVAFAALKEKKFVNRGFLNGPICPVYGFGVGVVVGLLQPFGSNLILLYVISTVVVTILEWLTGFLLEKLFHSRWWDYSEMPMNLNGYVCLPFSLIWGVACVFIVKIVHPVVYQCLEWLPTFVGIPLICILGAAVLADLYVTVSGIMKLNKRLAAMEKIAAELHSISEDVGENIYRGVMDTLEKKEDMSEEMKEHAEDFREHVADLKQKYEELAGYSNRIHKRLLSAFPKMKSLTYKESLKDLQNTIKKFRKGK